MASPSPVAPWGDRCATWSVPPRLGDRGCGWQPSCVMYPERYSGPYQWLDAQAYPKPQARPAPPVPYSGPYAHRVSTRVQLVPPVIEAQINPSLVSAGKVWLLRHRRTTRAASGLLWCLIDAGHATRPSGCGAISDELSPLLRRRQSQRLTARAEAILVFGKGRCEPPQPSTERVGSSVSASPTSSTPNGAASASASKLS